MPTDAVRLTVALADPAGRAAAAERLARHLGADALTILVEDPAVDALVPAMGFPATLPGGDGWRALLAAARTPGRHRGTVAFPAPPASASALAYADAGIVLVFLGGVPDNGGIDSLDAVVPLLAAALQAERETSAARGEKLVALSHAREAEALASALDGARGELERTLRALEERSRSLDEARERAERAVRAKDEFLAMLGHELRNPLSPILTAVQLLRLNGRMDREHEIIERQVRNLIRLVDDLLDVSRLTSGKIELRKERIEIADAVARAIEMASPVLERKQQVLSVQIPSRGLAVEGDPTRLAQVFANLLTNAAKYSDEGTRITVDASGDEAHVRVCVTDEGIGISREMLDRVFELFEQQRQAIDRSQGGLGLGLTIVRSLVMLHGGTVRATSEGEGKGSEFVVELPRAVAAPDAGPEPSSADRVSLAGGGTRVLIVDDNLDALALLDEILTSIGYVVEAAADGPAALKAAERFHPEVAILDIGLPVMDGYELAERLRRADANGMLRLIAVTGYGQEEDRRRSAMAGFAAHLVKPVAFDELERVLSEIRPSAGRRRNPDELADS